LYVGDIKYFLEVIFEEFVALEVSLKFCISCVGWDGNIVELGFKVYLVYMYLVVFIDVLLKVIEEVIPVGRSPCVGREVIFEVVFVGDNKFLVIFYSVVYSVEDLE